MWKCDKCETMNRDTVQTCQICHYDKRLTIRREKRQRIMDEAKKYMDAQNYLAALRLLQDSRREFSDDPELRGLYVRCEQRYVDEALARSEPAFTIGKAEVYDVAIGELERVNTFLQGNDRIFERIRLLEERKGQIRPRHTLEIVLTLVAILLVLLLIFLVLASLA